MTSPRLGLIYVAHRSCFGVHARLSGHTAFNFKRVKNENACTGNSRSLDLFSLRFRPTVKPIKLGERQSITPRRWGYLVAARDVGATTLWTARTSEMHRCAVRSSVSASASPAASTRFSPPGLRGPSVRSRRCYSDRCRGDGHRCHRRRPRRL